MRSMSGVNDFVKKNIRDKELSLKSYLFFVTMVFLLTGVGLFIYSLLFGVDPWLCQPTSSCVFYLGMGFLTMVVYLVLFVVKRS